MAAPRPAGAHQWHPWAMWERIQYNGPGRANNGVEVNCRNPSAEGFDRFGGARACARAAVEVRSTNQQLKKVCTSTTVLKNRR